MPPAISPVDHEAVTKPLNDAPPVWIARTIGIAVCAHFAIVAIALAGNVGVSSMQSSVLALARPYLAALHLDNDSQTLAFSADAMTEKTYFLQKTNVASLHSSDAVYDDWTRIDSPLVVGSSRRIVGGLADQRWQRFLSRVAALAKSERGDLTCWLLEPIAKAQSNATFLRIIQEPDLMTNVVQDASEPPLTASIIRSQEGIVQVTQLADRRLSSVRRLPSMQAPTQTPAETP